MVQNIKNLNFQKFLYFNVTKFEIMLVFEYIGTI